MRNFITLNVCFLLVCAIICYADISQASLTFVANVDGNWDLFLVNEDGSDLVRLTSTPYDEKEPSWSSDRKKIVYATSDGQLNIIDLETKEHEQLAIDKKVIPRFSPSFSPDGKKIAFVQFKPGSRDDTDLMIFDLETKSSKKSP
jgi:TolB protein